MNEVINENSLRRKKIFNYNWMTWMNKRKKLNLLKVRLSKL